MSATAVKAGRAYVELGVNSGKLIAGLNAASRRLSAFSGGVRRTGLAVAGIGAAALGGLAVAAKSFASAGARIRDMQLRTGIAAETLSRLDYAAAQTGTSMDAAVAGVRRLSRQINDANRGLGTATRVFEELGIDLESLNQMSLEEQFVVVGDALSRITDETTRAALAQEVFGRSGLDLIPIFEQGADTFRALAREADSLGLVIGEEEAKQAKALDDSFTRVTRTFQRVVATVGGALAPAIESLANRVATAAARVQAFIAENQSLVQTVAKIAVGLTAAGAALVAFAGLLKSAAIALIGIGLAVKGVLLLKAAFLTVLSPVGLVAAAVGAATASFLVFTDAGQRAVAAIGSRFGDLAQVATNSWNGIVDAIRSGNLALAGEIAIVGLELVWRRVTEDIRLLWNDWVYDLAGALVVIEEEAKRILGSVGGFVGNVVSKVGEGLRNVPVLNQLATSVQVAGQITAAMGSNLVAGSSDSIRSRIADLEEGRTQSADSIRSATTDLSNRLEELVRQAGQEAAAARSGEIQTVAIEASSLEQIGLAAAAGTAQADSITGSAFGTFSATAARRTSFDSRWQTDLLSATRQIVRNTQNSAGSFA